MKKTVGDFMKGMGMGVALGCTAGIVGTCYMKRSKKGLKYTAGKALHSIGDLLENMTNNPNSNTVMLGTNANGVSYNQVAAQQGRSYFYSANYNNYVNQYGSDAMLATNRAFISNAKNAGKTFWFSHNPLTQLSNSAYANSTYTSVL